MDNLTEKEKEEILKKFIELTHLRTIKDVYTLNKKYQFVKTVNKVNKEILYHVFINYEPIGESASTIETAMLIAICYNQCLTTVPVKYMANMIHLQDIPQFEESVENSNKEVASG